jgi:hypothetical protein
MACLTVAVLMTHETGAASKLDGVDLKHLYGYIIANHLGSIGSNFRWPEGAIPEGAPFRVGVYGRDPFGGELEKFFADRRLKGRPLTVVRSADPAALAGCQLIFADRPSPAALAKLAAATAEKPVVTVVFAPDGTVAGGMIGLFLMKDGSLRFTLDIDRIRGAQLVPSPGLLQLALRAPPP